jgi:ribosomal protein S20
MANHFSALKRARQTTKRTARNRARIRRTLRTALRDMRESLEKGDKAAAGQTYRETVSRSTRRSRRAFCTRIRLRAISPACLRVLSALK